MAVQTITFFKTACFWYSLSSWLKAWLFMAFRGSYYFFSWQSHACHAKDFNFYLQLVATKRPIYSYLFETRNLGNQEMCRKIEQKSISAMLLQSSCEFNWYPKNTSHRNSSTFNEFFHTFHMKSKRKWKRRPTFKQFHVNKDSFFIGTGIATSCQLQGVRNLMVNIQNVSKFFNNSPKRQLLLEKMPKKGHLPDYKHFKLIDVCRTRWVLQIDGLERFLAMCVATAEALPFVIMLIDYGTLQQVMYMHFPY